MALLSSGQQGIVHLPTAMLHRKSTVHQGNVLLELKRTRSGAIQNEILLGVLWLVLQQINILNSLLAWGLEGTSPRQPRVAAKGSAPYLLVELVHVETHPKFFEGFGVRTANDRPTGLHLGQQNQTKQRPFFQVLNRRETKREKKSNLGTISDPPRSVYSSYLVMGQNPHFEDDCSSATIPLYVLLSILNAGVHLPGALTRTHFHILNWTSLSQSHSLWHIQPMNHTSTLFIVEELVPAGVHWSYNCFCNCLDDKPMARPDSNMGTKRKLPTHSHMHIHIKHEPLQDSGVFQSAERSISATLWNWI